MKDKVIIALLLVWMALFLASCHVRQPSEIRPGMTKEEVVRAWGGTYYPTQQIREGKQVEVWEYRFANTGAVCRIVFYQDRVTTTECWRGVFRPWWY
jgi:hypothetical protein